MPKIEKYQLKKAFNLINNQQKEKALGIQLLKQIKTDTQSEQTGNGQPTIPLERWV